MFYGKLASNFFTVIFKGEMTFRYLTHELGKGRATKSDDFSEKFPTAFDRKMSFFDVLPLFNDKKHFLQSRVQAKSPTTADLRTLH